MVSNLYKATEKLMISRKQSMLRAAIVILVSYFSLASVLWAQSYPAKSVKEPQERVFLLKGKDYTFFFLTENGTGFHPMLKACVASTFPFSLFAPTWPEAVQSTYMLALKHVLLINQIKYETQFIKGEREQLEKLANLAPSFYSNRISYIKKLVLLDQVLEGMEVETHALINTPKIGKASRENSYYKLHVIQSMRSELGVSERKISSTLEWSRAAPGHWLVFEPYQKIYVYRQKLGPVQ